MNTALDDHACEQLMAKLAAWSRSHIGRMYEFVPHHPDTQRHAIERFKQLLSECGLELRYARRSKDAA